MRRRRGTERRPGPPRLAWAGSLLGCYARAIPPPWNPFESEQPARKVTGAAAQLFSRLRARSCMGQRCSSYGSSAAAAPVAPPPKAAAEGAAVDEKYHEKRDAQPEGDIDIPPAGAAYLMSLQQVRGRSMLKRRQRSIG